MEEGQAMASGANRWPSNSGDGISDEQAARLRERARFVRLETIRLISIAKVGHYASAFSAAEIFAKAGIKVVQDR